MGNDHALYDSPRRANHSAHNVCSTYFAGHELSTHWSAGRLIYGWARRRIGWVRGPIELERDRVNLLRRPACEAIDAAGLHVRRPRPAVYYFVDGDGNLPSPIAQDSLRLYGRRSLRDAPSQEP